MKLDHNEVDFLKKKTAQLLLLQSQRGYDVMQAMTEMHAESQTAAVRGSGGPLRDQGPRPPGRSSLTRD